MFGFVFISRDTAIRAHYEFFLISRTTAKLIDEDFVMQYNCMSLILVLKTEGIILKDSVVCVCFLLSDHV